MPVLDRIRDRVRRPDCLFAAFPDDGGKVLSPMNGRLFPRPGLHPLESRILMRGCLFRITAVPHPEGTSVSSAEITGRGSTFR